MSAVHEYQMTLPFDDAATEFREWLEDQPLPDWLARLRELPILARYDVAWRLSKDEPTIAGREALLTAALWPEAAS